MTVDVLLSGLQGADEICAHLIQQQQACVKENGTGNPKCLKIVSSACHTQTFSFCHGFVTCRAVSCRVVCQRSLVFLLCPLSLIPSVSYSWVVYPFPVDSESARRPPTSVTTCWNAAATFCVRPSLRCGHAAEPCKPRARSALQVRNHFPTLSPLPAQRQPLLSFFEWSLFKPCCGMAFAL